MCYSITSTEILQILRYRHITTEIKQYLTCKYDILKTRNCKGGHVKFDNHYKNWLDFYCVISLSSYYRDQ